MSLNYRSRWMDDDLEIFRRTVRDFVNREFVPHQARWREQHRPDADAWLKAGATGLLLTDVPEEYGGGGGTFAHEAVVLEELAYANVQFGSCEQSVVAHYLLAHGTEAQKTRWLPRLASGELVGSIAMSEPGAGSDLQAIKTTARRSGDGYVIHGSKTFITNGYHTSLICLAAKTDPNAHGPTGISMILVETDDLPGYHVGRSLEKIGTQGQDTCELFFDEVRVPADHLLGTREGIGFAQMMERLPFERLSIAISAVATAKHAVAITSDYVKERHAFGKPLLDFQNTRFRMAECATDVRIGRVFIDDCIERAIGGEWDGITSAMAKYWLTACECRVVDECLQLHGGYGYMAEYPIARMWTDSRLHRIGGGTNEIMKEIIGWSL